MTLDRPEAQDFIIVGATGDLSRRKLLPALYNLFVAKLLPDLCEVVGFARSDLDDEKFRALAHDAVATYSRTGIDENVWREFSQHLGYTRVSDEGYEELRNRCRQAMRIFYLATPPDGVPTVVRDIGRHGLSEGARIVVEKPFGTDLTSARELNRVMHEVFSESQIFRIDHYLGKETVQNILVFRFANSVFERVWNRDAVDHIQITIAESIGIEGRGDFYEDVGALRDIVQNHALQMLALLMMEPPVDFDAESVRDERTKLLRAVQPADPRRAVYGQYTAGTIDGRSVLGYRDEKGVAPDSETETFVALRLEIDNWRWAGVPIFLRTGKRLPYRATEAEAAFRPPPAYPVENEGPGLLHPNHLTHRIQPEQSISFKFLAKVPGPRMVARRVDMTFSFDEAFMVEPAEAYERLIHDVLIGDPTLFVREDAVERAWQIVQPLLDSPPPLHFYPAGTWGPVEADALVTPNQWHLR